MPQVAGWYAEHVHPLRKRWRELEVGLYGPTWENRYGELGDERLHESISGGDPIACFSSYKPRAVGLDFDDHTGNGNDRKLYLESQERMPPPSLLVQSPRGLHAYWGFSERVPSIVVIREMSRLTREIPAEIRPTPSSALRTPRVDRILDPRTLQPIDPDSLLVDSPDYHPAEVLGFGALPADVLQEIKEHRGKPGGPAHPGRLATAEARLLPLENGNTNSAFTALIIGYREAGLSQAEAVARFTLVCLGKSPAYTGDLRNTAILKRRVKSLYTGKVRIAPELPRQDQSDLFRSAEALNILERSPFMDRRPQRQITVLRLIEGILWVKEYQDLIADDPSLFSYFSWLYQPFYAMNRENGYYPLSRNFLRALDQHYREVLDWMIEVGLMEPAPFRYSPILGVSNYYRLYL